MKKMPLKGWMLAVNYIIIVALVALLLHACNTTADGEMGWQAFSMGMLVLIVYYTVLSFIIRSYFYNVLLKVVLVVLLIGPLIFGIHFFLSNS